MAILNQELLGPALDYGTGVGLGFWRSQTRVAAFGHNPAVTTAEDIVEAGGNYPWLAAATQFDIVCASTNDTAPAGTGARSVTIAGLDDNFDAISEILATNGGTATTVNSYRRINLFTLTPTATIGAVETNDGDITLRVTGGGAIHDIMKAGIGFGASARFTVANGFTLFVGSAVASILTAPGASTAGAIMAFVSRTSTGVRRIALRLQITDRQPYLHITKYGIVFPQKTDFVLRVLAVTAPTLDISAAWEGVLVDNRTIKKVLG